MKYLIINETTRKIEGVIQRKGKCKKSPSSVGCTSLKLNGHNITGDPRPSDLNEMVRGTLTEDLVYTAPEALPVSKYVLMAEAKKLIDPDKLYDSLTEVEKYLVFDIGPDKTREQIQDYIDL